jgi:signal transduction histidine kinase
MDWLVDLTPAISGLDAIVELSIAVLIVIGVRRRLGFVPSVALLVAGYFVLETLLSLNRVFVETDPDGTLWRAAVIEVLGTAVIVTLLFNARWVVDAVTFLVSQAKFRAAEYERARRDYTQVVRHRINNPLTIIMGAAQTLETQTISDDTRRELRRAIIQAAQELEQISLAPERQGPEEAELDAIPHVSQ